MATSKDYYETHKVEVREYQRTWRKNNPQYRKSVRKWNEANPEKMKQYRSDYNISLKGKLTKLRLRAKRANITFDIKINDFLEWYVKQGDKCYYCGRPVYTGHGQKKLNGYSFDRRDNNKGYMLDNLVLSCNQCNMIKGSWFTEEQMLEIAHKYLSGR